MGRALAIAQILAVAGMVTASLLVGCTVQDGTGEGSSGGGVEYSGGSGTASGSSSSSGGSTSATQPMLVVVDPDRTMNATPGNGVGVFTQYETGGHWDVWWTCDTLKSNLPCAFDVTVTVTTGTIANVGGPSPTAAEPVQQATPQSIELATTTTTGIDGMTFDTVVPDGTTPVITLNATLSGVEEAQYLFFVQDGQINGNYSGNLTDPLMLEPSSP